MWDLIVSVPDHCLSLYLEYQEQKHTFHQEYGMHSTAFD